MTSGSSWTPQASQPLPRKLRAVVYEDSWHKDAALIISDVQRFDEVCAGLFWLMEYGAHLCPQMPGTRFFMARAIAPGGIRLRAFFSVNDQDDPAVRAWHVSIADDESLTEEDDT